MIHFRNGTRKKTIAQLLFPWYRFAIVASGVRIGSSTYDWPMAQVYRSQINADDESPERVYSPIGALLSAALV